jgi:hypothetical protein
LEKPPGSGGFSDSWIGFGAASILDVSFAQQWKAKISPLKSPLDQPLVAEKISRLEDLS